MTIGRRLIIGFALFWILLLLVSVLATAGLNHVTGMARRSALGHELKDAAARLEIEGRNRLDAPAAGRESGGGRSDGKTDDRSCSFGSWLSGAERREIEKEFPGLAEILGAAANLHERLHKSTAAGVVADEVERSKLNAEIKELSDKLRSIAEKNTPSYGTLADEGDAARRNLLIAAGASALLTLIIALAMAGGINASLRTISSHMDGTASQIDATSFHVSLAGKSLAKGVSEQASALAQTTSSLEQMASMIKQNAVNATTADEFINEAGGIVEAAAASVAKLIESMEEISDASAETNKIVKTIDEIAFQTNILALNAAVEAARAGEAGSGFAVVADEVRNLAIRSAEASQRTSTLIENTILKIKIGAEFVGQTADAFSRVAESTARIKELMGEVAEASHMQSQDVEHMGEAVAEMEKVTRENAESAGKAASLSQELGSQGDRLRSIIGDMIALVAGNTRLSARTLESVRRELRELAGDPRLASLRTENHRATLGEWLASHPEVEAVYSNRSDGAFIYSQPPAGLPNASVRPWWQRAMEQEEYVSPVYISAITKKPCCTLSLPLLNGGGKVAGVLGIDLKVG